MVNRFLNDALPTIHADRRATLGAAVLTALRGNPLTVTALGRGLDSTAKEKHRIKRIDRLLSNPHLDAARMKVYAYFAACLVSANSRPVILIDWSDLDGAKRYFLLRAAVPVSGRALTLYEEIHPLSARDKPTTHDAFLQHLHTLLPANTKPILITDAGFRNVWFKQVLALGWDYLGRLRGRQQIQWPNSPQWQNLKHFYTEVTPKARCQGQVTLTRSNPLVSRVVTTRLKKKHRTYVTKFGKRATARHSERHVVSANEPWVLATSLDASHFTPARIVQLYALRMQLEESFRDLKSIRFGLGCEVARSIHQHRFAALLLIAALTLFIAWMIGAAAQHRGLTSDYQANTIRHRPVLSLSFLGKRVVCERRWCFSHSDILAALQLLKNLLAQHAQR